MAERTSKLKLSQFTAAEEDSTLFQTWSRNLNSPQGNNDLKKIDDFAADVLDVKLPEKADKPKGTELTGLEGKVPVFDADGNLHNSTVSIGSTIEAGGDALIKASVLKQRFSEMDAQKADKVRNAEADDIVTLNTDGNIKDSGRKIVDTVEADNENAITSKGVFAVTGDVEALTTEHKDNLVDAINELDDESVKINGDYSDTNTRVGYAAIADTAAGLIDPNPVGGTNFATFNTRTTAGNTSIASTGLANIIELRGNKSLVGIQGSDNAHYRFSKPNSFAESGLNLFSGTSWIVGKLLTTSGEELNSNYAYCEDFIKVAPTEDSAGRTIRYLNEASAGITHYRVIEYDSNRTATKQSGDLTLEQSWQNNAATAYIRIVVKKANIKAGPTQPFCWITWTDATNLTMDDYVAYNLSKVELNTTNFPRGRLLVNKNAEVSDISTFNNEAKTQTDTIRVGFTLCDDLTWGTEVINTQNCFYTDDLKDIIKRPDNINIIANLECTKYTTSTMAGLTNDTNRIAVNTDGRIYVYNNSISSVNDIKGEFVYELATPRVIVINNTQAQVTANDHGIEYFVYDEGNEDTLAPKSKITYQNNLRQELINVRDKFTSFLSAFENYNGDVVTDVVWDNNNTSCTIHTKPHPMDATPTFGSTKPVTSNGIKEYVDRAVASIAEIDSYEKIRKVFREGAGRTYFKAGDELQIGAYADASIQVLSGSITATIDGSKFVHEVREAKNAFYRIAFTNDRWSFESTNQIINNLSDFGITITGTPENGTTLMIETTATLYDLIFVDVSDTSAILEWKYLLAPEIFDAPEALLYCPNGLAAGTYHFTVANGAYDQSTAQDGTYQFTLTKAIPKDGYLKHDSLGGYKNTATSPYSKEDIIGNKLNTFNADRTALESSITVSEGNNGADLGTCTARYNSQVINNADLKTLWNNTMRQRSGNNDWSMSNLRKKLNSNDASNYWYPSNGFDLPPNTGAGKKGFLYDLDQSFVDIITPTEHKYLNTRYDNASDNWGYKNVNDDMFLLSIREVNGSDTYLDGNILEYYQTNPTEKRIKTAAPTTAQPSPAPSYYWLRSATPSNASNVYDVGPSGAVYSIDADNSIGVSPSCTIGVANRPFDRMAQIFRSGLGTQYYRAGDQFQVGEFQSNISVVKVGSFTVNVDGAKLTRALKECYNKTYRFVYNGATWTLPRENITIQNPVSYGIVTTGTLHANDVFEVTVTAKMWNCRFVNVTDYEGRIEWVDLYEYGARPMDAPEYLMYFENGLPAGSYNIASFNNFYGAWGGVNHVEDGIFEFTLAKPIPAGGGITHTQIGLSRASGSLDAITSGKFRTYNAEGTQIEEVATRLAASGAAWTSLQDKNNSVASIVSSKNLGTSSSKWRGELDEPTLTIDGVQYPVRVNAGVRNAYGSNVWEKSNNRRFLNSDAASNYYAESRQAEKQDDPTNYNVFDRAGTGSISAGFLYKLDQSFVDAIKAKPYVTKVCKFDNASSEAAYNAEITDKITLLSAQEVGHQGAEGNMPLQYYSGPTGDALNNIRIKTLSTNTDPRYYWLRSAFPSLASNVYRVYPSGAVGSNLASSSYGVSPSCTIG